MFEPTKIRTDIQPKIIEYLNNGTYYYNYDILEEPWDHPEEYPGPPVRYSFVQVHLNGVPEYKRCVEAIIREHLTVNEEFDLINSRNKLLIGLSSNSEDKVKYEEYLTLLDTIKTKIKNDFKVWQEL